MTTPGFNAEASLYEVILAGRPQYRRHGGRLLSGQTGDVAPQMHFPDTFVIFPGGSCFCYEDTDRQMSICECD